MDLRERVKRDEKVRWTDNAPIWVSNEDSEGMIYTLTVAVWVHLALAFAVTLWTVIALLAALAILIGLPVLGLIALL